MKCRICDSEDITTVLSLGKTALANNFLDEEHLDKPEPTFPLQIGFCNNCTLVQLTHVVPPELMFTHYVYVTSTTRTFQEHFGNMASQLVNEFSLDHSSLAVDIGSNDGLLLKAFQKHGVRVYGVEPAVNLAELASRDGVDTINAYFGPDPVKRIIEAKGKADLITANNVFAHVGNIQALTTSVKSLLKPTGVFVIEAPYLLQMLRFMTFDAIYHEHLSYFAVRPLVHFFDKMRMQLFRIEQVSSHGGSLRIFVQLKGGPNHVDPSVRKLLDEEKANAVDKLETYLDFSKKVMDVREKLTTLIEDLKSQGKTIAGYGAPAKATTLLSFCGLGPEHILYIIEDNPLKQGLYTPHTHIKCVDSGELQKNPPDYILILAWNFAEEIREKLRDKTEAKAIIPLPEPIVV